MSEATDNAQAAANEANARLQEMEAELARLPEEIKQAERRARASTTEEEVEKHLREKEKLERRQKTLPYLIPQQRIAVLRARAVVVAERIEKINSELPAAITERDQAKAAFELAQKRFKEAEAVVSRLTASASGASSNHQILLLDAENLAAGKETIKYFTGR